MSIISLKFGVFLIAITLLYFLMPKKIRWCVLLVGSYIYYFLSSAKLSIFLIITTVSIYYAALAMNKIDIKTKAKCEGLEKKEKKELKQKANKNKKIVLILTIIINFGILAVLKYGNFISENINKLIHLCNSSISIPLRKIILPLGISYYTLQAISYVVDVYRGKYKAEKNFGKVALFLSFFPQMIEGPIGKFDELAEQLYEPHEFDYTRVKFSLQLMLWGLFKKMVIADRAALYVNEVFGNYSSYSGIIIVMAVILYTVQIYAEFSGCIDIVRGIGQMYGITMAENFRRPFFSKNIQEFWRRWHITLGAWLREYIFYPVSFSKACINLTTWSKKIFKGHIGKLIPAAFALFFVWFGNGIWHGASWKYIFYGLYYYILTMLGMLFEPVFTKMIKIFKIKTQTFGYRLWQMTRTTIIVFGGMLIFRAHRLKEAWIIFKSIFTFENIGKLFNGELFKIGFDTGDFVVLVIGVVIMFIVSLLQEKGYNLREKISKQNILFRWLLYYTAIFTIIIFGIYGTGYSASSFIYGQF